VNRTPWDLLITAEAGALITVNGVVVPPTTPGAATYARAIDLTSGPNTLVIVAVDAAGNRASRTVTIVLDTVPPSLQITGPEEGATTGERQVVVTGTTEPGANLTVAGAPVAVGPAGEWSAVVQLLSGTNRIVVQASDAAGNTATASRTVTRSGAGSSITGIPFIDQNGWFLLILVVGLLVAAMVMSGNRAKRRALGEKSASIEREMESSQAMRNDFDALANFTPRTVGDQEFVSAEQFRHKEHGEEHEGSPKSDAKKPRNAP
jgi:hypothetical protein